MKNPPEIPDCGAMQDNCGNWVVWMRPDFLDEIQNEIENNGDPLALLKEVKREFSKCLIPPPSEGQSFRDAQICQAYCLTQEDLNRMRSETAKVLEEA